MPGYDHLSLGIDVTGADKSTEAIKRINDAMRSGAVATLDFGKQAAHGLALASRAFADATRESASFAAQHPLMIAGFARSGYAVVQHARDVDKLADAYRALRLVLSPTLATVGSLGTGIAIEALLRNAENIAKQNREVALVAARSGLSFQDVLAKRTAAKIEGGDFQEVFGGKGVLQIKELVAGYAKLTDPVDKAAYAVEHFGANAEKAMPMLRSGLLDGIDAADKFAASVTKLDRESIERLSGNLNAIPQKVHEIAASFREWWHTGTLGARDFALAVAHVADTIGVGQAPDPRLVQGVDAPFVMPTFGAVAKQKADAEATKRAILMLRPVDSDTLRRSDSAIESYRNSREGIQGDLDSAEARRAKYLRQLTAARGTDLEQTVRTGILTAEKEIAGYRASIKAIEDKEKAVKDLEAAMKSLDAFEKQMGEKSLDPVSRIFAQRDDLVASGAPSGRATGAALRGALPELAKMRAEDDKRTFDMALKAGKASAEAWDDVYKTLDKVSGDTAKEFLDWAQAAAKVADELARIEAESGAAGIVGRSSLRMGLAGASLGPGQELQAIGIEFAERKRLADELYDHQWYNAKTLIDQEKAFADWKRTTQEAEIDHAIRLAQLQRQRIEEFRSEMGGLFDAMMGGKEGLQQFAVGQAKNLGRAVFSNIMTSLATGSGITRQSTFAGAGLLGDMFGGQSNPLKAATDFNTTATMENTRAMMAFSAKLSASSTGGGGGYAGAARSAMGGFSSGSNWTNSGTASDTGYTVDGVPRYSPDNYDDYGNFLGANGGHDPSAVGASARGGGGGFTAAKGAAYGASAAGVGFGIYGIAKSPSTKGKIGSGGAALMSIAPLTGPAAPFVAAAGMALEVFSAFMKDPKQVRAEELERDRQGRAFNAPTGQDYSVDIYGRSFDYNYRGEMRPVVVNNYISAMDAQSFEQWGKQNPGAISSVVSHAAMNDEQIPATLSQVMT
jgi:hypothetical protein